MIKICKICNTPIDPISNNQKYCSRKCKNRGYYLQRKENIVQKRAKFYNGVVCAWCGAEPIEYHHLDPKGKNTRISIMLNCSDKTIQEEINKCIPLCKPCHMKAHIEINNRTEHFCEFCGKKVVSKGNYVKKRCSNACRTALYRKNNREKVLRSKKKYREENKEKIAISKKMYRLKNRDKINKYKREYRKKNHV